LYELDVTQQVEKDIREMEDYKRQEDLKRQEGARRRAAGQQRARQVRKMSAILDAYYE